MDLKEYFENRKGFGVLSTADGTGRVNSAVYSRPHAMDDGSLAFLMPDRLTHFNLQSNPRAAYLFREEGPGYKGKRLHLTKIREETDPDLVHTLRRRHSTPESQEKEGDRFVVFFRVDKVLPLIGPGEEG
ncbi:MAG TPA: pyridoxamine 5'-phosphate oxidase family protein [Syntrophobacteraceae bacterium]|nr:pyridoxamine 5'-phosphate oxidase family protein [Syntrophobacteraceae bacterium]